MFKKKKKKTEFVVSDDLKSPTETIIAIKSKFRVLRVLSNISTANLV